MGVLRVPPYPVPPNERERLAALDAFGILDTVAEPSFDRVANMAARLLDAPIALVSLVDKDRQWFKARCGLEELETPRDFSFCTHAMLQDEPMVVCDATKDVRFQTNPLVTGEIMAIRFYVGAPLRTREGLPLGTVCAIDKIARERPSQKQLDSLADLAYLVSQQMELRSALIRKDVAERALRANETKLKEAQKLAHLGHWEWNIETHARTWSDETYRLFGLAPQSVISEEIFQQLFPAEERERVLEVIANCLETGNPYTLKHRLVREDGSVIHIEGRGRTECDAEGRPISLVGTMLDVTAQVQADLLLRQSNEELERRVSKRTELLERSNAALLAEIAEHELTQALVSGQNKVLHKIAEGAPIERIFEMLMQFGGNEAGAFSGGILLKTEDGKRLRWVLAPTVPEEIKEAFPDIEIAIGNGSAGEAAYLGKRVVVPNLERSAWPAAALLRKHLGARSLVSTPILDRNNQVLGTVSFACQLDSPTDYELRVQDACASLATIALLRDRGYATLRRWEQMFKHASWGMALASTETEKLLAVNPAYAEMLGYSESDLIGKSVFDVFGQAVMSRQLTEAADCFADRSNVSYESVWKRGSGSGLPVMIDIVQICDTGGKPLYWSTNVMDLSERKKASSDLRDAFGQSRVLADLAPEMFWIAQADGAVTYYNEKWCSYTGRTAEQTQGWNWSVVMHPDDLETCVAAWTHALISGERYEMDVRLKRASDGMYRWHLARALPFRDGTGKIVKWFGSSTDIHEKKTENERLEAVVETRTEQLRHLLTEKETLLKEVHHRVKNNLQVISSLLRMQVAKVNDPAAAAVLADTRERVISMALIHERLYSSQQMDAIDFGEYTRMLVNELFCSYALRERNVVSRVEAGSVFLKIDQAIPCGLILNELVTNALKYAYPAGSGGQVLIELKESATEVCLTVSDEGVGLPAGWTLEGSKSLGLMIVGLLAKQLGGTLRVSSGLGASFAARFAKEQGGKPISVS